MKLKIIAPIVIGREHCESQERKYRSALRSGTEVHVVSVTSGPSELTGYATSVMSDYGVLLEGQKAKEDGFDAVVPDCTLDPAGKALKERCGVPVALPLEASIHVAALLGSRFSVLALDKMQSKMFGSKIEEYGLASKLASVRSLDLVPEESRNEATVLEKVLKAGQKAVEDDGAEVIILGCTTIVGLRKKIEEKLGVPVIEPGVMAAKMAEVFVDLDLSQSKRAYRASK